MSRVLFVSPVLPEPQSSAAGVRTNSLIQGLKLRDCDISYVCASAFYKKSLLGATRDINYCHCPPNDRSNFVNILKRVDPQICIFDRFYSEEMFSQIVREECPNTMRVLDMQDCHFLRKSRQKLFKQGKSPNHIMSHVPCSDDKGLLRELASIHRSDFCLVCSPFELQLLTNEYNIPPNKMCLASFFIQKTKNRLNLQFGVRKDFVTIGTYKHEPNIDSVRWLAEEVWDKVRAKLNSQNRQSSQMHCYGAHWSQEFAKLNDPSRNFFVRGHLDDLSQLEQYRVLLSPLRFGAGLKGKIVDAWRYGLPVATTPIGAEGLIFEGNQHVCIIQIYLD
eukprot:TRINITY_DN2204_c1_g1_i2.p1 TRINITY_DN2204_c1_g1~~TRINITY_DN2204_c1_g1_i2.p1  ORF type:complete len:334 (-),score=12.40 TRINITY_DN2204_c1_g1_i2:359-1360(-)